MPAHMHNGTDKRADATKLINQEITRAKKEERKFLTAQSIKRKILKSNAQEIWFTLQIDKEAEHEFVFVQDENHWQVAVDRVEKSALLLSPVRVTRGLINPARMES